MKTIIVNTIFDWDQFSHLLHKKMAKKT